MKTRTASMAATGGQWTTYALGIRNRASYLYAQEFYRTAQKAGSPLVRAYLIGHALELFLKTFLLTTGMKTSELKQRKYGHNLVALLEESKTRGLANALHISPKTELDIHALNEVYPEKLRYFSLLYLFIQPTIPVLARLFRLAKSLEAVLLPRVKIAA